MRRAFRFALIAVLISSLGLLSALAEPREAFHLEDHLPASTLAFVSLDNLDQAHARWEKTSLGRMFADEEMQAFFAPIMKQFEELSQGRMSEIPPQAMELVTHLHGLKGQVALGLVDVDPEAETISAALSIDFGDSPAQFVEFLTRMHREFDPKSEHVKLSMKNGRFWLEADLDELTLYATTHDTTLIAATDEALLTSMLKGESRGLGQTPDFQTVRTRCGKDGLAVFAYAGVGAAFEKFRPMMPEEAQMIGGALGLDTVKAAAYGMAFHGDGFRDTFLVYTPGADHGLIPVIKMRPLSTPRTLDLAPATAFDWAEASINFDTLIPNIRALVQKIDPDATTEMDEGLKQVAQMVGVDVEKEVLAGLQGTFGYFMALPPAGGLYPELAMTLQVKDGAAYEGIFERLMNGFSGLLNEEGDVISSTRVLDYHGTKLHLFEVQAARGDDPIPFTPTWAVMGDRLVITLVPYTMKELVLRASGRTSAPGLSSKEDFQALMAAKPADAGSMEYVDLKGLMGLLYGTAVPLLQTMVKPNMMKDVPIQVDWALLPPASRMAPYFRSMASFGTWDENGIAVTVQSPVPMLPIVAVAMGAAMFLGVRESVSYASAPYEVPAAPMRRVTPSRPEAPVAPMPPRPGGGTDIDREMDQELAKLHLEIFAEFTARYRLEKGKLPTSLQDLVDAGYMRVMLKDPWGSAYGFDAEPAGEAFRIVSPGPDKRVGTSDDVILDRK